MICDYTQALSLEIHLLSCICANNHDSISEALQIDFFLCFLQLFPIIWSVDLELLADMLCWELPISRNLQDRNGLQQQMTLSSENL